MSVMDTVPWAAIAYLTHTPVVLAFDILTGCLAIRTLLIWRHHATTKPG